MFGTYSYHKTTRYATAVFGTLFNDIDIVRKDGSDNVLQQQRVPLAYGNRQKWLARIDEQEDFDNTKVEIKLPRMSFDLTGFSYDSSRQTSKFCEDKIVVSSQGNAYSSTLPNGAPYNLSYELNIYTVTHDDAYQIIEQIIPHFKPSYSVIINPIDDQPTISQNVVFILNSIQQNHQFEGPLKDRQILVHTLSFDARAMYYGPIGSSKVIKTAIANIYEHGTTNLIKGKTYAVNPSTATEDDVYTIDVTESFGFDES